MNIDNYHAAITDMIELPHKRKSILQKLQLTNQEKLEIISLLEIADLIWLSAQKPPEIESDQPARYLGILER